MFDVADQAGAPRVVLISETAAHKYWPHDNPVGRRVKVYQGGFDAGATVIGVVGDVRFGMIDSLPAPDVYIPYAQSPASRMMIFLRTDGAPLTAVPAVRRALHEVAPQDPVYDVASMVQRAGAASAQARFSALLLAIFAGVALALAVMGIYGVMSFGVQQRTREIGIRVALGADRRSILALVVREGILLTAVGATIGVAGALLLTGVLRTLLYEVQPTDPATYAVILAVIGLTMLAASWIPARRAAAVDAVEALRG